MNAVLYAALGTGFTFLMTAIGAAAVFCLRRRGQGRMERICMGFASGVMLAATVWSLFIPALEHPQGGIAPTLLGFALGTLLLLALEAVSSRRPTGNLGSKRLLFAAVTLHNIPEGMAVGLSCALAVQSGQPALLLSAASLALGVGLQNLPEGAALSLPLYGEGMSKRRAFALGTLSAVVEPVFGILAALTVTLAQPLLPGMLAAAAGAMLLVTVRELIPQACGEGDSGAGTLSVLMGFVLMMILDVALG